MQQKKFFVLLLAVLAVATGWHGVKESRAEECPIIDNCTIIDSSGNPFGWMAIAPDDNGEWPVPVDCTVTGTRNYAWRYQIYPFQSWGQGLTLVPNCCPDLGVSVASGGQVLSPGSGDPTTGFGKGIFTDLVVRTATVNDLVFPAFYTPTQTMSRNASWQFKVGRNLYYCPKIAGPACPLPSVVPIAQDTVTTTGPYKIKIVRSGKTGCGTDVKWMPANSNCQTCWEDSQPGEILENHVQVDCGTIDGNQGCRECVSTFHSALPCSSYYLGNVKYWTPKYNLNGNSTSAENVIVGRNSTGTITYTEACPNTPPVWPCDGNWRDSSVVLTTGDVSSPTGKRSPLISSCSSSSTTCSVANAAKCSQ